MKVISNPNTNPVSSTEREKRVAEPGFGKYYTDNMVMAQWSEATGWADATLQPYGPITLDPAAMVFHYGQEIFEGMKAYSQPDGGVSLFRPDANAKRFAKSAARIALPEMPVDFFVKTVEELVKADAGWVPKKVGESLYIRPFMIATEVGLGVRPSNHATYILIATPAAAYFNSAKAVTVWISTEYVRAALGGTGEAKCGGNYAASLLAQKQAAKEGCDQVVYIDAKERKWVEEMGGMNLYFIKGSGKNAKIITPKLTGTLLPGITRDSILTLANDLGYQTEEAMISIDDWKNGVASGEITEIFACGTAAVISAIGTGIRDDFKIEDLRYGKVIIMTDADDDGAHIAALLMTFFYRFMRPLVLKGHLYLAKPPLYRVTIKNVHNYIHTEEELNSYRAKYGDKIDVTRFKGLGEMDADELGHTTMEIGTRQIIKIGVEDAEEASNMLSVLMGNEVGPRKAHIIKKSFERSKEVVN